MLDITRCGDVTIVLYSFELESLLSKMPLGAEAKGRWAFATRADALRDNRICYFRQDVVMLFERCSLLRDILDLS